MFKKLIISFLLIILVITLALTVFFAHYSDGLLSQDILDAHQTSAESITGQCNNYIITIQDDLLVFAIDESLQTAFREFQPDTFAQFPVLNRPGRSLECSAYPIRGEQIYGPDQTGRYVCDRDLAQEIWVRDTIERNGKLCLSAVEVNGIRYIRFSMLVTDMDGWERPLGILATDVQMDTVLILIGKTSLSSQDYMILVDGYGQIQYPYRDADLLSADTVSQIITEGSRTEPSRIFIGSPIQRSDWYLVITYSTAGIQARTAQLYRTVAVIAVITMLLAFVMALLPSYQHARPIINLTKHIKENSYLQPIEVPHKLNRDYQSLYVNYNEMVEQINSLMGELYETNKRERETQLKMLQAQLNPHFIYNVLDSISWLSVRYQAKDIQMMVSSLATMLRCSLNSGRDILMVSHEIRHIQSYLNIQTYRYDSEILVSYDFEPEIMEKSMIKLLLQPLVENALIHGLETFDGDKHLKVSGRLEGDMLIFEVANNGNPPDLARIGQILSGDQQVTTGYGIRNVNERIKTAYGGKYCLRYETRAEWTVANITVPAEPVFAERM